MLQTIGSNVVMICSDEHNLHNQLNHQMTTLYMTDSMDREDREDTDSEGSNDSSKPKRKRQRLDHLSQEEKLMRRKLKNRMAAQSARDRKKVRMQDLEQDVLLLSKQKNCLTKQNISLKQMNQSLEKQNKELLQRLTLLESIKSETKPMIGSDWSETIESAELISGPQPQEQVSHPVLPSLKARAQSSMTPFVYWLITIQNLMIYSMFFTCIQKISYSRPPMRVTLNCRQSQPLKTSRCHDNFNHHIWDQLKT